MSWSNNYIGRQYNDDVFDCWHLVESVLKEQFEIDISSVRFVPVFNSEHTTDEYFAQYESFSSEWRAVEIPQEGDLVLFFNDEHIGVMTGPDAFLHTTKLTDAVIERIDAYWESNISGFYRHSSRIDSESGRAADTVPAG